MSNMRKDLREGKPVALARGWTVTMDINALILDPGKGIRLTLWDAEQFVEILRVAVDELTRELTAAETEQKVRAVK